MANCVATDPGSLSREVMHVLPTTPAVAYAGVSDVVRTAAHSEEIVSLQWLARARPREVSVGDRFESHNQTMGMSWSARSVVTGADPGRLFSFVVGDIGNPTATWTFTLAAAAESTLVTYRVTLRDGPSMFVRIAGGDNVKVAAAQQFWLDAFAVGMAALLDSLAVELRSEPSALLLGCGIRRHNHLSRARRRRATAAPCPRLRLEPVGCRQQVVEPASGIVS